MGEKDAVKSIYRHYILPVRSNINWPNAYSFIMTENLDQVRDIFAGFEPGNTCFSMDLETSDLNPETGFIVGVCLSVDGQTGYYVPINHYESEYNLGQEALDIIYDYMTKAKRVFVFNAKFDFRFWEYYGFDKGYPGHTMNRMKPVGYNMSAVKVYDVSVPCWLSDTNIKMPSLKDCSLHFLGIKQQSFEEVTDGVSNFYYTDPKQATFYGASDAICTFLLVPATIKYFKEAKFAGEMDQAVLYPLMHYEQEKIQLDRELLNQIHSEITDTLAVLEREIYRDVGYAFKLNSPAQVSEAFQSLGIDTGKRTKTGYMQTGIELLENLPNSVKARFPALSKFIEFKTLFKAQSSYVNVLKKEFDDKGYLRCNYKTQQVPTGRLASGKDLKNKFFSEINIQSIPKPHPKNYYIVDLGDRSLISKKDNIVFGFQLFPAQYDGKNILDGREFHGPNCLGVVESFDPHLNIRNVFLPGDVRCPEEDENEWTFVSIDYAAQELRIPANLSGEPAWVNSFVNDEDVHRNTAILVFGKENYNKEMRKRAKGVNFGILYGLTPESFAEDVNISVDEAKDFFKKYKEALPTLFLWQDRLQKKAKRDGVVYTYFGRPRRVKFYFENGASGFGYRTISNTIVQGSAGDILKIAMIRLWNKLLNHPEYKEHARFITTVHDEVDFAIRSKYLEQLLPIAIECMRFELPEWPVVIDVSPSVGFSWGSLFELHYDRKTGHFSPKLEVDYSEVAN